jgi:hypothetical protein
MKRVAILLMCLVAACACKSKADTGPGKGSGTGTGGPDTGDPAQCDKLATHLEELYRADATATAGSGSAATPEMLDEIVKDNVTMAMSDCKAAPTRVTACAEKAKSAAELEDRCLIPLDEEGTEGDQFKAEKQ